MTTIRFCAMFVVSAAVIALTPATAQACSCMFSRASACEVYEDYDVAFIGRVLEAGRAGGDAKVRIDRVLKGAKAGSVEVMRNDDAGIGCGYRFEKGVDYVIFARRNESGEIQIEWCSSTIWEERSPGHADAIRFVESFNKPPRGGWIFGTVEHEEPYFGESANGKRPVEGGTVSILGPVDRRVPIVKGRYDFFGLPPGKYTVRVDVPDGYPEARSLRGQDQSPINEFMELRDSPRPTREVTIAHERACAFSPFGVLVEGRLSGLVVNSEGRPVPGVQVEVAPASMDTRREDFTSGSYATTDGEGRYSIGPLPEGTYVVGINLRDVVGRFNPRARTVVPGPAGQNEGHFTLRVGEERELPALELGPPVTFRRLSGVVVLDDKPVSRAFVTVMEADRAAPLSTIGYVRTEHDGRFSVEVADGRSYVVIAEMLDPTREDPITQDPLVLARGGTRVALQGDRDDVQLTLVPVKR